MSVSPGSYERRSEVHTDHASRFPSDPWVLREIGLDQRTLAQSESLFALSNGHIGVRGNLDEGDPNGLPGTYLNSFYETRPLPYAEAGYGDPETGQTILNVTNGKLIRLLVDDEPFDLRYGQVLKHERVLDLRRGVLERYVDWQSPAGKKIRVHSSRLVSLNRRAVMAIRYRVQPIDSALRIVLQSELVANEPVPTQSSDPRASAAIDHALQPLDQHGADLRAHLVHQTRRSGLRMAAAMDHHLSSSQESATELTVREDWARITMATSLQRGEQLELTKYVAYGWSATRAVPTLRDQVDAALVSAKQAGWDAIEREQQTLLDDFWDGADVEIEGADEIQRAVRFGIFNVFQNSCRAEQRCIPAKGLTGPGYDGHAFWDTDMFVLPLLTATAPHAAADALRWRLSTLDTARDRARTLRLRGATFPWRTINGEECSGYWPAGTAAMHINADVASAAERHVWWTHDEEFERTVALPLLVETARLWSALGYRGDDGLFHIDGVTGPDEYTAVVDDNVYTNLMAKRNFIGAVLTTRKHRDAARDLDVTDDEIDLWTHCAENTAMPFNKELGVHEQDRGFTLRAVWDFDRSNRNDEYPLLLHAPYFELYRRQVIKQADLVLAMHWACRDFTPEEKAANFAYYDALTVRDSSLSACTQAVIAAEVGHLDLAADYLAEAALTDLRNLQHNARDGLHLASLAGGWLGLVAGFGGMRDLGEHLAFRPQLPPGWQRLKFAVHVGDQRLHVDIRKDTVQYRLRGNSGLTITHWNRNGSEDVELVPGEPTERRWHAVRPLTPRPTQPAGRPPYTQEIFEAQREAGEQAEPSPDGPIEEPGEADQSEHGWANKSARATLSHRAHRSETAFPPTKVSTGPAPGKDGADSRRRPGRSAGSATRAGKAAAKKAGTSAVAKSARKSSATTGKNTAKKSAKQAAAKKTSGRTATTATAEQATAKATAKKATTARATAKKTTAKKASGRKATS